MCSLHLTHPSGAVGSRHCSARGAVGGSVPCPRVSPQSWTLPARAGIRTHNLGLPRVSSPTLYPLGHDCPDRVHHPRTGNDHNKKDTDRTASWKRCDRPWFALLEFVLLVKVPRGNRCREGLRWLHGEWLTYAKSTSQFHWRFLLKSEMIGASK